MAHNNKNTTYGFLRTLYQHIFPLWIKHLIKEFDKDDTVLDLGCGKNSPLQHLKVIFSVGVDSFYPYLEESRQKLIHNAYIYADIKSIEFMPKSFDVVIALDVLEHLDRTNGYKLIQKMELLARKKIILFCPNGYVNQDEYDCNPGQKHLSAWNTDDLRKLGFKVNGINGFKPLRGYQCNIKFKPYLLWLLVSDISQWITFYFPKIAFQLFAVKETGYSNDCQNIGPDMEVELSKIKGPLHTPRCNHLFNCTKLI
jgi:SAM-dependent methyltransferase